MSKPLFTEDDFLLPEGYASHWSCRFAATSANAKVAPLLEENARLKEVVTRMEFAGKCANERVEELRALLARAEKHVPEFDHRKENPLLKEINAALGMG